MLSPIQPTTDALDFTKRTYSKVALTPAERHAARRLLSSLVEKCGGPSDIDLHAAYGEVLRLRGALEVSEAARTEYNAAVRLLNTLNAERSIANSKAIQLLSHN